jgi:hypothetical protein
MAKIKNDAKILNSKEFQNIARKYKKNLNLICLKLVSALSARCRRLPAGGSHLQGIERWIESLVIYSDSKYYRMTILLIRINPKTA